jgi:excisionase family DNA binding protein
VRLRSDEKVYTPLEVARLINVHVKSVANWIRQGMLQSYRTPGGHNRIPRTALVRFLNQQSMPMPEALLGNSRRRILVVDDDPIVGEIVSSALRERRDQYEITAVHNGIEALMEIGRSSPDLVILDIFMPELNGFSVCRQIKGNPERSHLRILSLSGKPDPAVREKILACGADAFMLKPLEVEELLRQIETLTRS